MGFRLYVFYFTISVFMMGSLHAGDGNGMQLLKIPLCTSGASMGNSSSAYIKGAGAVYINPAGLLSAQNDEVGIGYYHGLDDAVFYSAQYSKIFEKHLQAIAFSLASFNSGDLLLNDINGYSKTVSGETAVIVTGSFAHLISEILQVGVNIKMINAGFLENKHINVIAGDLGLLMKLMNKKMSIGLILNNAGGRVKYLNSEASLPTALKFGAAYSIKQGELYPLTALVQIQKIFNEDEIYNVGLEIQPLDFLAIRSGYQFENNFSGFSAGLGVKIKSYTIDSSITFHEFNNLYSLSLSHGI